MKRTGALVVQADALRIPMRDESVDLIITSPPFFALRSYRDDGEHYGGQIGSEATPRAFLEALWATTAEMARVLKPAGSIFVNLGDKYSQRVATPVSSHQDGLFPERPELRKNWKRDRELGLARMPNENLVDTTTGQQPIREKSLMGLPWRYAIGCMDQLGLILRAEVIWDKPNGLPESVADRVRRSHEQWFMFVKQGRYYSAVDEIREQTVTYGRENRSSEDYPTLDSSGGDRHRKLNRDPDLFNPLGKLPGSVWTIPSEPLVVPQAVQAHYDLPDHFAAFPQEWPRRLILGWSPAGICTACGEGRRPVVEKALEFVRPPQNRKADWSNVHRADGANSKQQSIGQPGENRASITGYACACDVPTAPTRPAVVLDPFAGTGTVPMVARALGRLGVGIDLSHAYCRLARWRIWESGHAAKAEQRTWTDQQNLMFPNMVKGGPHDRYVDHLSEVPPVSRLAPAGLPSLWPEEETE